ncbi:MAG: chorismate synthase [Erysipelothrix sp.]|nr:chorismate synthase [Erysipelothrix sp.]
MANEIGKIFKISLFGESHNKIIGVTIDNLAPGLKVDSDLIKANLLLRRPKRISETKRIEVDNFEIVSGYFNGYTTGAPLTILVFNQDVRSDDYDSLKDVFRPSHVDYPASKKALGYEDYRGAGHYSGRLTTPLVIAGSIALQILNKNNIYIKTHIKSVSDLLDKSFDEKIILQQIQTISKNNLPVIDHTFEKAVLDLIETTSLANDSLGASLESAIIGIEPGLGEPFFNKLDASIAYYLMSIPAIKGVSFGKGFDYSKAVGSEVVDEYYYDKTVKTKSNHNGGIIGGVSSGMPIIINSVVKPASSINQPIKTIRKESHEETIINIKGRHDSSIFTRIPVIVDSLLALALVDAYCVRYGYMWQRGGK